MSVRSSRILITQAHGGPLTLLAVVLVMLLSGCGMDLAFTPEAAVAQTLTHSPMPDFTTDPTSIRLMQKQAFGKKFMVLVSFQGIRSGSGRENCMFSYEVIRSPVGGWMTGGGGGGCSNQPADPETQPIGINSGGGSGGDANDPGYSQIYGEVFNPKVKTIQVSWNDGTVEQITPVNSSYFSTRVGRFDIAKVETLDEQGQVIYSFKPEVAPGK